jgi:hypothetical protein
MKGKQEWALVKSTRKSIGMHKDAYIFYTNKIYFELLKRLQTICEVSALTCRKIVCHYVERLQRWNLMVSTIGRCPICVREEKLITTNKNIAEPLQQSKEYYRPRKLSEILSEMQKGGTNGR